MSSLPSDGRASRIPPPSLPAPAIVHFPVYANVRGMRNNTLYLLLAVGCFSIGAVVPLDAAATAVEARATAQSELFEEYYQSELQAHPERATSYGDYRYNDRLDEYSLAAIDSQHARDQGFLARLEAIPTSGFSEQDA